MGKYFLVEEKTTTYTTCDICSNNKPIVGKVWKCAWCKKDLCKRHKRHIHVETGTGNGQINNVPDLENFTTICCPCCLQKQSGLIDQLKETSDNIGS